MEHLIETAANLAREWHRGQVDKSGVDYFEGHLTTVASYGRDWKESVVGYLHDAAEDTPHTVADVMAALRAGIAGDSEQPTEDDWAEIEDALNMMNHNTTSSREEYIDRFSGHSLALRVKLNDLRHNMDPRRIIPNANDFDRARQQRYAAERQKLRDMLDEIEVRTGEFDNDFMHYDFLSDEMSELEFMVMLTYARHRKGLSIEDAIASVNRQRPPHFPELTEEYYTANVERIMG